MGAEESQFNSKTNYGFIFIKAQKKQYYLGDVVNASICVQLTQPYPAKYLEMIVYGEEKSAKTLFPSYDPDTSAAVGNLMFLRNSNILQEFADGILNPGQYEFPFSLVISDHYPPTFSYDGGLYAKIYYKISAHLRRANSSVNELGICSEIIFRKKPNNLGERILTEIGNVAGVSCKSKGSTKIEVNLVTPTITIHDPLKFKIRFDNSQCGLDIIGVYLEVQRTINIYDQGVNTITSPLMIAMESPTFPQKIMRGTDLFLWKDFEMTFKISKNIPGQEFMQPSVDGTIVKCIYELKVNCIYNECSCCGSGPNIRTPITFTAPEISDEQIGYTDNWNPHIYQSYSNEGYQTTKKETTYFEVTK